MRENRNIFFIRNRLVKNDYKFPQKTSCFITEHSLDRQILSSKTFCSTQNSFRDSINSSKEKSTKPSKVEIPSITLNNFKKLQFMINAKRKGNYLSFLFLSFYLLSPLPPPPPHLPTVLHFSFK